MGKHAIEPSPLLALTSLYYIYILGFGHHVSWNGTLYVFMLSIFATCLIPWLFLHNYAQLLSIIFCWLVGWLMYCAPFWFPLTHILLLFRRDFRKSLNIIVAVIVNGFEPRLLGRSGLWNRFLWCRINYALSHYFKGSQTTFTTVTQATQILWKEYFEALHVTLVHKNISSIVGCEDVCFHWQNQ